MNVDELIERLSQLDPELIVAIGTELGVSEVTCVDSNRVNDDGEDCVVLWP
jgi:hypothetical protein